MKKLFFTWILSMCMSISFAQLPTQAPTDGLIAYYPFTGNANDVSGNNNNPTINSATLTTDRNGVANSAYFFNGNSFISIPNRPNPFLPSTLASVGDNVTMAAWVRVDAWDNGYAPIVCKTNEAADVQYRMCGMPNAVTVINNGRSGTVQPTNYATGQWVHIASVSTQNSLTIYINGIFMGTTNVFNPNVIVNKNLPLEIGRDAHYATEYFNGALDEVAIYNRVLTQCEVQRLAGLVSSSISFSQLPINPICSSKDAVYSVNSVLGASSYLWKVDGVAVSGATAATYTRTWTNAEAGSHNISVEAVYPNCPNSPAITTSTTVIANPTVADISGNNTVCKGQFLPLSNTTAGGTWLSSNTSIAGVNSYGLVSGIGVGSATIFYRVISNGCATFVNMPITVKGAPDFKIVGNTPVCPNSSNTYSIDPQTPDARYYWIVDNNISMSHNDGISTSVKVNFPDNPGGTYTVKAISVNACGSSAEVQLPVSIKSDVPPRPIMKCSGTDCETLSVDNSIAGVNIDWYVDGQLDNSLNGKTSITRTKDKQIRVVFTKGTCSYDAYYFPAYCVAASMKVSAGTQSSIDNSTAALKIYPNPNSGAFTFHTRGYNGRALVYNAIGVVVKEMNVTDAVSSYDISLDNLTPGTYLLKLTGGDKELNSIFIVE